MKFSHIDKKGTARMVDVSGKPIVRRTAIAQGTIHLQKETIALLKKGLLKKGDALACARLAGIMAAKKTPELIPLCHGLALEHIVVDCAVKKHGVVVSAMVQCTAKTGAEMEALTAVSIAALTIYDMCKAVDKKMVIGKIFIVKKEKGPAA